MICDAVGQRPGELHYILRAMCLLGLVPTFHQTRPENDEVLDRTSQGQGRGRATIPITRTFYITINTKLSRRMGCAPLSVVISHIAEAWGRAGLKLHAAFLDGCS